MLRHDVSARALKYQELKSIAEEFGIRATVLQAFNSSDAIEFTGTDTVEHRNSCLMYKRDALWFLRFPDTPNVYRIESNNELAQLCRTLFVSLRRGFPKNPMCAIQEEFELSQISGADWMLYEFDYRRHQWEKSCWVKLSCEEAERAWRLIDNSIGFPKIIVERTPLVVYDFSFLYLGNELEFEKAETDLTLKTLRALRKCTRHTENIYALIWNSSGYDFNPHQCIEKADSDTWAVPVLPDGDFYCFVAHDLRFGLLGLADKKKIVVFGQNLLDAFKEKPPDIFCKGDGHLL
jgi:hypothetical protein